MEFLEKTAVLIPAYKPDDRLPPYVDALLEAGVGQIVIVDDGSGDGFSEIFDRLPHSENVHVIHYIPNAGKGVALKTGLSWLRDSCLQAEYIVTADSDGQHTVKDVLRLAEALYKQPEGVWLGSRDFSQPDVPPKSRFGNRTTSGVFKLLYGVWVGDTQTGLRAFSRRHLELMCSVKGDRYEYEMNVLIECAHRGISMPALTIETVYENNNEGSHFRAVRDSARIYGVIFAGFFRFISSSVISFLVDYGLYLLLNALFRKYVPSFEKEFSVLFFRMITRIALATVLARLISGTVNFLLNRNFVFRDSGSMKKSFPRYLVVFVVNMLLSAALTSTLHLVLNVPEQIIKVPVDLILFLLNYRVQEKWVFSKKQQ